MKNIIVEYWHVEVFPLLPMEDEGSVDWFQTCIKLKGKIEGCIDNVEVNIAATRLESCSYCGSKWVKDGDVYNGGCCSKDEKNRP